MPRTRYRINITEAAEQDLSEIIDYIASENPSAALKLALNIEKKILRLEQFPLIGVVPRIGGLAGKGYRILIVDDFLIFYVIAGDRTIEIRRIVSGKRDYQFLI